MINEYEIEQTLQELKAKEAYKPKQQQLLEDLDFWLTVRKNAEEQINIIKNEINKL